MSALSRYLEAARRAGAWLAARQHPGGPSSVDQGLGASYKAPWALAASGQAEAGNVVLDILCDRFVQRPGDFVEPTDDDAKNTWRLYRNACILVGAARLGRWDVACPAAADRVCAYQHPCGGFAGNIDAGATGLLDPTQTAQAGWSCLALGRHEAARRAADFVVQMLKLQPDLEQVLYTRFDSRTGKLVTEVPQGQRINYLIDLERTKQQFFHAGIAMGYLADMYLWTGKRAYLDAAKGYLDFDARTNPEGHTWPSKCKVGWGAALLYRVTGEPEHREVAERVADITFLKAQQDDGSWPCFVVPRTDDYSGPSFTATSDELTAEFTYELAEIVRGLSRS